VSLTKKNQDRQKRAELKKTKTVAIFRQIVRGNHPMTLRSTPEEVNIDRVTVRKILTEDLDMRKVCAKKVSKELTEEQKNKGVFG
jgi:hypothetical protein